MTLSVLHAGSKDRMVMRSLLNLISGRSDGVDWHLSDEPGGDITIIDVDNSAGEQTWASLVHETGAVIAMTRRQAFDAPVRLQKPLRSREFLQLLGRVAGREAVPLAGPKRPAAVAPVTAEVTEPPATQSPVADAGRAEQDLASDADLTLADHLRCQTWSAPVALTSAAWPMLLIDPCSGTWFFDGSISDLDPAQFARPIPAAAGVALSNSELVERIQGHRQRTLSELKWYAGLAQLPGRLHPELRGEPEFMLTQVPPEAMKNELLHQLARIALRGPIDLERLLVESGQPEANVSAFLNACFCSGKLLINRTARAASF
ncbi:hypothetical protein G3I74_06830 [Wenzhouxiangella sp. C33]|uniref:Uncharacterized protein n=2 Tax=Wenzhouxiangella limi TaxID=2707351 RepID=A0A845UVC9_9GAMM|nr:hypothetical protein [Wenzhouxiangella limi]